MKVREAKEHFEKTLEQTESAVLKFSGVEGFDVYNCSQPFLWSGKKYTYGRVENRGEWARSWVRLFCEDGLDQWKLVENSMIYQLEDPYISFVDNQIVFGGTHVKKQRRQGGDTYYGYFYRGIDLENLTYFTTGPEYMKDIRIVQLPSGKIGVFSRPRSQEILEKFGSESMVGFTTINSLDDLTDEAIETAPYLEGLFSDGEWGGVNQVYLLDSGKIGVLGHVSYNGEDNQQVYCNMAFVMDPESREIFDYKIIATRSSYPQAPAKTEFLKDCAFTSGMVVREDGMVDLYSGIGDTHEGRTVAPYPFEGHGKIVRTEYYLNQKD